MARSVNGRSRFIFFGAFERVFDSKNVKWRIVPRYKKIGVILAIAFIACWLFSAIAIWSGYKFIKKYDEISFFKVVAMPFYIAEHRRDMGEYNIRMGNQAIKDNDPSKAFQYLYKGAMQSPNNLEARMALAQIYFFWIRDPRFASTILDDKIDLAIEKNLKNYVKLALNCFMFAPDYNDKFVELANRTIANAMFTDTDIIGIATPAIRGLHSSSRDADLAKLAQIAIDGFESQKLKRFFASNASIAYCNLGDFNSAWDILRKNNIEDSENAAQIKCRIMWQNGEEIKALKLARRASLSAKQPENAYAVLSEFYRELGANKMADLSEDSRQLLSGNLYNSKLLQIENAESDSLRWQYIGQYLKTFSKSAPAIASLSSYAIKINNEELMRKCLAVDFENEAFKTLIRLSYVEFLIKNKKIDAANEELLLAGYKDVSKSQYKEMLDGLTISINALSGKNVEADIRRFVADYAKKPSSLVNLAKFFYRNDMLAQSEFICLIAQSVYPNDYRIPNLLAKIYFDLNDFSKLAKLAYKERIPIDKLLVLKEYINSDASIFLGVKERDVILKKISHAEEVMRECAKIAY